MPVSVSVPAFVLVPRGGAAARGATFDIVCPQPPAETKDQGSNNVKNGTSGGRAFGHADWSFPAEESGFGTANSKFEIRNSKSIRARESASWTHVYFFDDPLLPLVSRVVAGSLGSS